MLITLAAAAKEPTAESHVLPHYLFGSHWFTNHHLMTLVVLVLGVSIFWLAAKRIAVSPGAKSSEDFVTRGSFAQLIETICSYIRDEVARPMLGDMTDRYIPYLWSVFFFILLGNLLGLIPIGPLAGLVIGKQWSHIWGTLTGNLAFTGGLAVISLIAIVLIGFKEQGFGYLKHMWPVPMKPLWLSPLMFLIGLLVFALELLGLVIKAFALAVRLFANLAAGHLIYGSLILLILSAPAIGKGAGIIGAATFSFLELFVSFLQAYIFTYLTVIFISLGAVSHDHDHEHEHEEHAHHPPEDELHPDPTPQKTREMVATAPSSPG